MTSEGQRFADEQFLLGATLYSPPAPPRPMRGSMLKDLAKKHGVSAIRIFTSLRIPRAHTGRVRLLRHDEIMCDRDELGIHVLMGVVIKDAPYRLDVMSA